MSCSNLLSTFHEPDYVPGALYKPSCNPHRSLCAEARRGWVFCSRSPSRLTCRTWIRTHTGVAPNPMPLTTHYASCSGFVSMSQSVYLGSLVPRDCLSYPSTTVFHFYVTNTSGSLLNPCTCFASQASYCYSKAGIGKRGTREGAPWVSVMPDTHIPLRW